MNKMAKKRYFDDILKVRKFDKNCGTFPFQDNKTTN